MVYLTAGLKRLKPEGLEFVDESPESVYKVISGVTKSVCGGGFRGRDSDTCRGRGWISISIAIGHRCRSRIIIRWATSHVGQNLEVDNTEREAMWEDG